VTAKATKPARPATPCLALGVEDAAASIGVSRDTFERRVLPELRVVKVGTRILVPVREIERYLEREAVRPLEEWLNR